MAKLRVRPATALSSVWPGWPFWPSTVCSWVTSPVTAIREPCGAFTFARKWTMPSLPRSPSVESSPRTHSPSLRGAITA